MSRWKFFKDEKASYGQYLEHLYSLIINLQLCFHISWELVEVRRNMENNNQRALCQQLWAENKYLVLSHSSNIYKDIRQYLKQEVVELSQVQEMIDRACQIPEHRGQVCNAFQHIWGYFKKKATEAERKDYMLLLDRYRFGQASKEDVIAKTRDLLENYPNTYLEHSTLLKGDSHETLA